MICEQYQKLTPKERTEYIGQLIHSCMCDAQLFKMGEKIIELAEKRGVLDGVKINPINNPQIEAE